MSPLLAMMLALCGSSCRIPLHGYWLEAHASRTAIEICVRADRDGASTHCLDELEQDLDDRIDRWVASLPALTTLVTRPAAPEQPAHA